MDTESKLLYRIVTFKIIWRNLLLFSLGLWVSLFSGQVSAESMGSGSSNGWIAPQLEKNMVKRYLI
jgi:hypothetical protein